MAMILEVTTGASPYGITPEAGYGKPSAAEIALGARADLTEWWSARHGGTELVSTLQYWRGRLPEIKMQPITANQLPTLTTSGGPDGEPFFVGRGVTPPYPVVTPAGVQVIPNGGDWSLAFTGKSAAGSAGIIASVVGNDGGSIEIQWRSTNLLRVFTVDAAGTRTQRLSITAATGAWHYCFVSYKAGTGELQAWYDNAIGTGTPSVTGLTLAAHSERLALLGGYDVTDGVNNVICDNAVAEAWVFRTALHDNAAARAALRAVVAERYPSLTLAA